MEMKELNRKILEKRKEGLAPLLELLPSSFSVVTAYTAELLTFEVLSSRTSLLGEVGKLIDKNIILTEDDFTGGELFSREADLVSTLSDYQLGSNGILKCMKFVKQGGLFDRKFYSIISNTLHHNFKKFEKSFKKVNWDNPDIKELELLFLDLNVASSSTMNNKQTTFDVFYSHLAYYLTRLNITHERFLDICKESDILSMYLYNTFYLNETISKPSLPVELKDTCLLRELNAGSKDGVILADNKVMGIESFIGLLQSENLVGYQILLKDLSASLPKSKLSKRDKEMAREYMDTQSPIIKNEIECRSYSFDKKSEVTRFFSEFQEYSKYLLCQEKLTHLINQVSVSTDKNSKGIKIQSSELIIDRIMFAVSYLTPVGLKQAGANTQTLSLTTFLTMANNMSKIFDSVSKGELIIAVAAILASADTTKEHLVNTSHTLMQLETQLRKYETGKFSSSNFEDLDNKYKVEVRKVEKLQNDLTIMNDNTQATIKELQQQLIEEKEKNLRLKEMNDSLKEELQSAKFSDSFASDSLLEQEGECRVDGGFTEEELTTLNTAKTVIIGGHPAFWKKMKVYLPDVTYINCDSLNIDLSTYTSEDYTVFFKYSYSGHGMYYKLLKVFKKSNTDFYYLPENSNVELNLTSMIESKNYLEGLQQLS